ncbi:MAG: alpha-L-fucosidase, partial [Planctomycetota bacterium]
MKNRSTVLILLLISLTWSFYAFAIPPEINKTLLESSRQHRLEWWRQARFGMFIHWGLYAQLAGQWKGKHVTRGHGLGEWIMYGAQIPVKEYEVLAKQFNPVKFDADQWVQLAKHAGMKYIVITAKHCDGFAMYPSKVSQYNIIDATPFNRDPLKELQKACQKHGIKLGFYYSHNWDWHHPHAMGLDNTWDFPNRKSKDPNLYYKEKALPQVEELITSYRPHILWFDVPTDITRSQSEMFLEVVRKHSPDCIINDRIGNGLGDYVTPEQYVPAVSNKLFEVCMTLNDTWGYKYYDKNWKTPATVIRNLVDITAKGGNYLVNVGPTAEGLIPPASVRILQEIGKWMAVNGQSIYGTIANPLPRLPDDARCTAKPGKLYIHIFNWPDRCEFIIPAIKNKIRRIYLLADSSRQQLEFEHQNSHDIVVKLSVTNLPPDT